MTDRVLLELAAKATGRKFNVSRESPSGWLLATQRKAPDGSFVEDGVWRPLTDDGDALRLAVQLRIEITQSNVLDDSSWVSASRWGYAGRQLPVVITERVVNETERQAITRWTIVRAAAEIGKACAAETVKQTD